MKWRARSVALWRLQARGTCEIVENLLDAVSRSEFSPRADVSLLYFPAMVVGILLGHLTVRRIQENHARLSGRAMARTGLIVGYTTLIIGLAVRGSWARLPTATFRTL